ncbi:MAG: T9SS type A sorting domain-containing protein [Taibaiella sp.]|jgi:hypothetical protein
MKRNNLLLLVAMGAALTASAQTPFPTGTNVAIAKPGMNSAAINYQIYTSTAASSSVFTPGANVTTSSNINGIGINPLDNMVYGAAFTGNSNDISTAFDVSLYRIGSDGVTVDLGKMPLSGGAGSGSTEFVNFSAGTVSTNGTYYYTTYALKPGVLQRIMTRMAASLPPDLTADDLRMFFCWKDGLASLGANPGGSISGVTGYYELDFSHPDVTAAMNAFLTQVNASFPNVYNADGGLQDIAIHPTTTSVYGYISYPSGGSTVGRPVVMNPPVNGISTVTPVGTTVNTTPGQEAAGLQFDNTGNLYALFTTGDYAQVDLTTGALTGMTTSNITTAGTPSNLRGDLASAITNIPFPVKLMSFTGRNNGTTNELNWITATEQNNKGFSIERSEDLKSWHAIGSQLSKAKNGNSSEKLSYSFADNAPKAGVEYYRLKQTDRDGKVTYSTYISVNSNAGVTVKVYPNPTTETINISGVTQGDIIRVADITGKVVLEQKAENNLATISLGSLSPNMYFIQVVNNGNIVHTQKVIKK